MVHGINVETTPLTLTGLILDALRIVFFGFGIPDTGYIPGNKSIPILEFFVCVV